LNTTLKYQITAELLATLEAERYNIGVGEHLRIQTLLQKLPDTIPAEDLKHALISLIAKTKVEQERLYALFDEIVKNIVEKQIPKDEPIVIKPDKKPKTFKQTFVTLIKQYRWIIIAIAAVMMVVVGFYVWKNTHPTNKDRTDKITIAQSTEPQTESSKLQTQKLENPFVENKPYPFPTHLKYYSNKPPSKTQEWLQNNWKWARVLLAFAFCFLLFAIWRYRALKNRKIIAEQNQNDKPPYFWNIELDNIDKNIFETDKVEHLSTLLRHRSEADKFRIDIPKTIEATISKGGSPIFIYKTETSPTDYLLLIDRQSVRNHRARLFNALYEEFKVQEVEMARYFYDSDVRVCFNEFYPNGISISEILQRYYTARLILIGTGAQLLSPMSGKLAKWTEIFEQWRNRALFSPKPLKLWGYDERQLAQLFTTLPATLESLGFWIDELDAGADARFDTWREKITDAPNAPINPDDTDPIPILQLYFETDVIKWIAACAIYPTLHFDLTLWLGQQLSENKNKLCSYTNLSQIFRLSWFVQGEMPVTVRTSLIHWFEAHYPKVLLKIRAELASELENNAPPIDSAAYDAFRMHIAFNQLLTETDSKKKKELKNEIADLIQKGVEADATVIKYLDKPNKILNFELPKSFKKYIYRSGYAKLGWLKEYKDLSWLLPILGLGLVTLFWNYKFEESACSKDNLKTYVNKNTQLGEIKEYKFCFLYPSQRIVFSEFSLHDAISENNTGLILKNSLVIASIDSEYEVATKIVSDTNRTLRPLSKVMLESDGKILFPQLNKNLAIDFYYLSKRYYEKKMTDSACYYLNIAAKFDSTDYDIKNVQRMVCNIRPVPTKDSIATSPKKIIQTTNVVSDSNKKMPQPISDGKNVIYDSSKNILSQNPLSVPQQNVKDSTFNLEMVFVQGGTFLMGSKDDDKSASVDEKPQHKVTLSDFYIGKTEVTQAQWRAVMGNNPSDFKGDDLPVENVSWDDIQIFLKKLNAQSKTQYSLPTEAEWEFAARGGVKSKNYTYSGSNSVDDVAWVNDNSNNKTHAVGTKQANELGIYDMSGNVWEWCSDRYDENYYKNSPTQNPKGPNDGDTRVLRGGSWYYISSDCRVAYRIRGDPTNRDSYNGFRVARYN